MAALHKRLKREARGQAMVETALLVPFLLWLVFNTVNFGYFFFIAVNLAGASRSGALYSILGGAAPLTPPLALPSTVTVETLTLDDLTGAIRAGASTGVQVCSASKGTTGSGTTLITQCDQYNGSPTFTPDPDPEAPNFVLNRVDVTYTFSPLLDQRLFNLILLATPVCTGSGGGVTCTFRRQVSMRAMQ